MTINIESPQITKREAAAQDKIERILKASLELFTEKGFHGTAVPEVANKAEVGAGTIYRYFKNKEDLVNAVFVASKTKLRDYLLKGASPSSPLRQQFHQFWVNLCEFAETNPKDFHFLELQDHAPYLNQASKNVELEVLAPIWAALVEGNQQGNIKNMPADTLMAMVWGAFVGLMKAQTHNYIQLDKETLAAAEEVCWQMISKS